MKSKVLLLLSVLLPLLLGAAVKVNVSGQEAVLDNGIIRARFNAVGGKLVELTAFKNGKNLTCVSRDGKSGALKDFFAPKDFTLNQAEYLLKANQLPDGSGELVLTTPGMHGDWNFLSLTKKIRLAPGSSRLDVTVTISNKLERMAPYIFSYWSHNFFGVPGEDNHFIYAGPKGINARIPSVQTHARGSRPVSNFTRNFIAMLGRKSRLGVVMLADYSEMDLVYSWYCKSTNPLDTMEFRFVSDKVDHGSSVSKNFSVAVVSQLQHLAGAGRTGAGYLKNTSAGIELHLTGFETVKETFQIYVDGKKSGTFTAALAPGKLFKRNLGKSGKHYRVFSKNFDMELKLNAAGKGTALELEPMSKKRPAIVTEADAQWQFDPAGDFVTPHFVWQTGGKTADVLFLVPTNGSRDIIELKQRFKLNHSAPTVFPANWALSWRTVTDMHRPENGLNKLGPWLKRRYQAIVIGANAGSPRIRHGSGSWTSYPESLRKKFLDMAAKGSGLIIINPGKKDPALNAIVSKLKGGKKDLAKLVDLSAAPEFVGAEIRFGSCGKGKIAVLNFKSDAFIVPHPGYRGGKWKQPRPDHRYQEYQFAVIGKLLQWSCGEESLLTGVSADKNALVVTAKASGKGKIEIFDRFSSRFHTQEISFVSGTGRIKLPALRHGKNYIHVTADDGGFGYAAVEVKRGNFIKEIQLTNEKTGIKGKALTAEPLGKNETLQLSVVDNLDRELYLRNGRDGAFEFAPAMILTNRHILCARLLENGKVTAEERKEFYLPSLRDVTANYANMLWLCGDAYPAYSYFYRYKQYSAFGFNYHYSGSGNNGMFHLVRYSDAECGSNGHGCTALFYYPGLHEQMKKYTRTHDKKYLVRGRCPNDPQYKGYLASDSVSQRMEDHGTRKIFQLGDEMSITYHTASYDVCMCSYCMKEFRDLLRKKYGTLAKLNAAWDCKFKNWEEVFPLTYQEAIFKDKRAGYMEHRLYMDEVFRRTLNGYRERLRKKYPGSFVGPTGVNGYPSPYGGNFNFYSMKDFDCGSFYRDTRLTVSFDRDRRLVMRFRGYSENEANTVYSFWEGLALGERSNNNWYGGTFLLPDLRLSKVRDYYSKLLWELRSGAGDLLFHSRKMTGTAAILHSQESLIINFTKQRKTEFYGKELAFARALEDLGVPHRFIAPQQLDELDQFKVLFLPEASVLSDADAAKIAAFVKKGGLLVADVEPGTFDGLGNKRKKPVLDEVFGIDSSNASLRKIKSSTVKELKITYAGRGVKAVTAKSSGSAKMVFGKAPLYLENTFGKGRTLLLNFDSEYQLQRKNPAARQYLARLAQFMRLEPVPGRAAAERPILHGAFSDGGNRYIVLLPELIGREKYGKRFVSPFVLAKRAHLYDARKGKYLGDGKKFKITLTAGDGTLLAALPYKVEKIELRAPEEIKAGSSVTVSAAVKTQGAAKNHVLHFSCTDPRGKEVKIYAQTVKTVSGGCTFTLPSARNDLRGTWKITVRDAASGVKAVVPVRFK